MKWISVKDRLPDHNRTVLIYLSVWGVDDGYSKTNIFQGIFEISKQSIFEISKQKVPVQEGCRRKIIRETPFFNFWSEHGEGQLGTELVSHWMYADDIPKPGDEIMEDGRIINICMRYKCFEKIPVRQYEKYSQDRPLFCKSCWLQVYMWKHTHKEQNPSLSMYECDKLAYKFFMNPKSESID